MHTLLYIMQSANDGGMSPDRSIFVRLF